LERSHYYFVETKIANRFDNWFFNIPELRLGAVVGLSTELPQFFFFIKYHLYIFL
jgi:hypothetical protein